MNDATGRERRDRLAVVLVVLVLSTATVGVGLVSLGGAAPASLSSQNVSGTSQTQTETAAVQNLTFEGEGYNESQYEMIAEHPGPPFVWKDSELRINATIESQNDSGTFYLCGRGYDEDGDSTVTFECEQFAMSTGDTRNVAISIDAWPENATGNHTIVVELYKSGFNDDAMIHESFHDVSVIERDGDLTGDGLKNQEEFEHGTDITRPDTSGNGLTDWEEVKKYGTNPLETDTTGDGVSDATLVRLGLDPTEPYLLHRYLVGGIIGAAIIAGGTVWLIRKYRDTNTAAGEQSAETNTPISGSHRSENGKSAEVGEQSPIDESILTNEEVVCRALKQNDGRMRQSQIVDSTEWSKAKVSRVLSDLEENGVIQRIRIGRENVVDLNSEEMGSSGISDHLK